MRPLLAAAILALVSNFALAAPKISIIVDPGDVARSNTPITAELKTKTDAPIATLQIPAARSAFTTAQVEKTADGIILRWVEPKLEAGKTKTYDVTFLDQKQPENFSFKPGDGYRDLLFADKPVLRDM